MPAAAPPGIRANRAVSRTPIARYRAHGGTEGTEDGRLRTQRHEGTEPQRTSLWSADGSGGAGRQVEARVRGRARAVLTGIEPEPAGRSAGRPPGERRSDRPETLPRPARPRITAEPAVRTEGSPPGSCPAGASVYSVPLCLCVGRVSVCPVSRCAPCLGVPRASVCPVRAVLRAFSRRPCRARAESPCLQSEAVSGAGGVSVRPRISGRSCSVM